MANCDWSTGRPLTPEEQQRLARRERTLKNRRGRRNPAVMPDRLARTSAFVSRKVNLITDSNFTRVYEVPGYSVVEVRGRELGSQHRDAIYALFRLKHEKVSMPNPDYRLGTFIPPMRTYYETRTSWRELIRVMGRTEHVNNLLSLVHVFQEIQQVSVLIHEGRSLVELDKIKKTRSIGALPDIRATAGHRGHDLSGRAQLWVAPSPLPRVGENGLPRHGHGRRPQPRSSCRLVRAQTAVFGVHLTLQRSRRIVTDFANRVRPFI